MRFLYGGTAADITTSKSGRVVPGADGTAWFTRAGDDRAYDLETLTGDAALLVTSDTDGMTLFYGPDGYDGPLWLDFGLGWRTLVRPTEMMRPSITVEDTATLDPGSAATVDIEGDPVDGYALRFGLPAGTPGVTVGGVARAATGGRLIVPPGTLGTVAPATDSNRGAPVAIRASVTVDALVVYVTANTLATSRTLRLALYKQAADGTLDCVISPTTEFTIPANTTGAFVLTFTPRLLDPGVYVPVCRHISGSASVVFQAIAHSPLWAEMEPVASLPLVERGGLIFTSGASSAPNPGVPAAAGPATLVALRTV